MSAAYPILTLHDPRTSASDPVTDIERAITALCVPQDPWSDAALRNALAAQWEALRTAEG